MTDGSGPAGAGPAPESLEAGSGTDQPRVIVADSAERDNEVLVLRERGARLPASPAISASRGPARPTRRSTGRCDGCRRPSRKAYAATRWRGWMLWVNGCAKGRTSTKRKWLGGPAPSTGSARS